jgi:predicted Rossmann fold flavoprotein
MTDRRVIVVGAGAGGMMAAGRAGESGAKVLLLEKTEQPGQKLLISGKTRCNLTNAKELDDFIQMYGQNGNFLYGAFHRFFKEDLLSLLARYGVETTTERGGRIFPASGDARNVVLALQKYLEAGRVEVRTGVKVTRLTIDRGLLNGVETGQGLLPAGAVVLATGGASYPATGSTGDGYRMAQEAGHTLVKIRPSLVPLVVEEIDLVKAMQDVNLRNVRMTAFRCKSGAIAKWNDNGIQPSLDGQIIDSRMGEVLLTHFGLAGPITLQMSLAIVDSLEKGPVSVSIDLKPALTTEQLRRRLQRDFDASGKSSFRSQMNGLLPLKMIDPFIEMSGIPAGKPGHQINSEERNRLADLLKSLRFNILRPLPLSSALVTAGGVSLREIDPRSLASKLIKGLFLCGEVMDIDADTGGYNLQAAFSTGYVAGESAAARVRAL